MRETIVPAPDVGVFVARERRRAVLAGAAMLALLALAGGFVWNTVAALNGGQARIAAAEAVAEAARAQAEAARRAASAALADQEQSRGGLAEAQAAANAARNELLRTTEALASVKEALRRAQAQVRATEVMRDQARAEAARLREALTEAQSQVAAVKLALAETEAALDEEREAHAATQREVDAARAALARTETELDMAERTVAALEEHIGLSVALERHAHPVDAEDVKTLADSSDRLGRLLSRVLELREQKTPFNSANKPGIGFNSPGFTGYVLGRVARGKTLKSLPATDTPRLGDIIRYENGLAMFLLQDAKGRPFVIGMTPVGIAALEPDFGVPRVGALATGIFQE